MEGRKLNCWEERRCGREPGGAREHELGPCPAAVDAASTGTNDGQMAGRVCWAVANTLCGDGVQGTVEEKMGECPSCPFFRRVKYEEGCHFQLLRPGLGRDDAAELHRLLNSLVKLLGISRDIFACLAVRPLLARITQHAVAITGAASAAIYLSDSLGLAFGLAAHAGPVSRPEQIDADADEPVANAARARRLCRASADLLGHPEPATVAAIPVGTYGSTVGVLELVKVEGRFSLDDEWFLRELGLITGLGIENARRIDDLRELKVFDRAKSRFVALLMHQISSPLATIACSLQAIRQLKDTLSQEDEEELIRSALDRIDSVQALARRLLDLAAIRNGTSLAALRPVPPIEPLRQAIEDRRAKASEAGIEIVLTDESGQAQVLADPDGLRVIFANLLDNAIKYSDGPGKEVRVDLAADSDRVRARVRDRGIGIPAEEQTRVFEEFHRARNAADSHAGGFGIGLAVVKELVDRYKGSIELESAVGEGTSITVQFPLLA